MKWKNVTLAQFQQTDQINSRQDLSAIDRVLYSVCVLYDKTEYEVDNEKPERVVNWIEEAKALFESDIAVKAANRIGKYNISYDVSAATFGQYIELAFFINNNPVKHAHFILATMATKWLRKRKEVEHRVKADYFLRQPVTKVFGSVKSIQQSFDDFNKQYSTLFGIDQEVSGNVQNEDFNKHHGWIYSATRVKEHEGITLEETFALPVRRALNALVYIKAKDKYDVQQLRKSPPIIK